jgi:hypothetical protein
MVACSAARVRREEEESSARRRREEKESLTRRHVEKNDDNPGYHRKSRSYGEYLRNEKTLEGYGKQLMESKKHDRNFMIGMFSVGTAIIVVLFCWTIYKSRE